MMTRQDALVKIEHQRVVPVVRAASAELALTICKRLIGLGLDVIELTTTIPQWESVLERLVHEESSATIGMGTITNEHYASVACDSGAQFLVSPFPVPEARQIATVNDCLFIGGGFTPAEIAEASAYGPCKLFPAHLGGKRYLATLRAILPTSRIMPTGGIAVSDAVGWLAAGAFAVGIGSDLYAAGNLNSTVAALQGELTELGRHS